MSSTNRGRPRVPADEYRTPHWAIEAILDQVNWQRVHRVLEPCAGDGRIVEAIANGARALSGTLIDSCDIRKGEGFLIGQDYLTRAAPPQRYNLLITNPPFSLAQEIATKAMNEAHTVCLLQRLSWLEGQARAPWWRDCELTHLFVLSKRPSFVNVCSGSRCKGTFHPKDQPTGSACPVCGERVKAATDSTGYAWFVWDSKMADHQTMKMEPGIWHL